MTRCAFFADTYETEILKVLGTWSSFDDGELEVRPRDGDPRGRTLREHMVHQCVSENLWFQNMLGIRVTDAPLPATESRVEFLRCYARDGCARLTALREQPDD